MRIRYSKQFVKQLAKQPEKVQKVLKVRLLLFEEDVSSPLLRTHPLQGKLKGYYSINVTGDIRALYQIVDDELYSYDMIGSHSQLYG